MSKTKRIKALKEFIELEKLNKNPVQEYIDWAKEEIAKLEAYLKKEHQRVTNYLILTSISSREAALRIHKKNKYKDIKLKLNTIAVAIIEAKKRYFDDCSFIKIIL